VKAGHQVTIVTGVPNVPNGLPYEGYRNRLYQEEVIDGMRVVRVWSYLAPNKGTARRVLNYLSFMMSAVIAGLCLCVRERGDLRRPDVVVATSPQFFCGWAGAIVSRLWGLPFVLEIRDIWPESVKAVGAVRNGVAMGVMGWLEQRLYSSARLIVTVGEGYRQKLLERGVPSEKIGIVSNGIDRERFVAKEAPAEMKARYGGGSGKFICSYVGTVGMAAGLQVVLRAGAMLRARGRNDIQFLIVGDGAELEDLRASAAQQQLTNVSFTGRVPKEQVPDYLALSDACLVHLRKQDLFETVMPSKIFESLAMLRPVILGVRGFAADFLAKSGGGICIEPENVESLLLAIDRLRNDPALGRTMAEAGRDYVLRYFDRDKLADDYLVMLNRVIASVGAPETAVSRTHSPTGVLYPDAPSAPTAAMAVLPLTRQPERGAAGPVE